MSLSGLTMEGVGTHCQCMVDVSYTGESQCASCINTTQDLEWKWDASATCPGIEISGQGKNVTFHMRYSSGTAATRGDLPMRHNYHYFWEIVIYTRLYGTDVMVGVATPNFALDQSSSEFASLLGKDSQSWGFSYTGKLQHGGEIWYYCPGFESGDVIGCHLDMWSGTLSFYKNGKPLGVAFRGLRSYPSLYPVVCSSAAQISMGLVTAVSIPSTLFTMCCRVMARYPHLVGWLTTVPGLKNICQYKWLFQLTNRNSSYEDDEELMFVYRGPGLFRTVPGLSTSLVQKCHCKQRQSNSTEDTQGPRFSSLMDRAVTRPGAWGEFTDENAALPCSTHMENSIDNNIYSDLMSSEDEESSKMVSDDMFEHKEKIKFTNSFSSPLCEICKLKPAVSVKSCLKKCLQCLFLTKK